MIKFGMMEVEWFASIRREKFDWSLEGLNIIQAPNGHGKTKFINALIWCIYGKTLSGSVEPWDIVKDTSYRGTKISLEVFLGTETAITITRYREYGKDRNRLKVVINNEAIDIKEKKDIQIAINEHIGYSYELFKNSIIFGQKLKRLIAETGPNKKKVFDDAFEIAFIPKAKKIAEVEANRILPLLTSKRGELDRLLDNIESLEKSLEQDHLVVFNFEATKEKDIKAEQKRIHEQEFYLKDIEAAVKDPKFKGLKKSIRDTKQLVESLKTKVLSRTDLDKLVKKETILESNIKALDKSLKELDVVLKTTLAKEIPTLCPICNNFLTSDQCTEESNKHTAKIVEIKDAILNGVTNISTNKESLKGISQDLSSARILESNYINTKEKLNVLEKKKRVKDGLLGNIKTYKDRIEIYQRSIKNIEARSIDIDLEMKQEEVDNKYLLLKPIRKEEKYLKKDYEIKRWIIEKPLSNAGLKAFIFNQMMDAINERLLFYSKYVGFQVEFIVDMESHNKDLKTFVFKDGEPVPYEDLSGGQQQAVDIASAFAIHDVVSNSKDCNLLVMDELFESLDKNNIEIMTELIQDKAKSKALYLVTHRSEFCPTNANVILIKYKDGITSLD